MAGKNYLECLQEFNRLDGLAGNVYVDIIHDYSEKTSAFDIIMAEVYRPIQEELKKRYAKQKKRAFDLFVKIGMPGDDTETNTADTASISLPSDGGNDENTAGDETEGQYIALKDGRVNLPTPPDTPLPKPKYPPKPDKCIEGVPEDMGGCPKPPLPKEPPFPEDDPLPDPGDTRDPNPPKNPPTLPDGSGEGGGPLPRPKGDGPFGDGDPIGDPVCRTLYCPHPRDVNPCDFVICNPVVEECLKKYPDTDSKEFKECIKKEEKKDCPKECHTEPLGNNVLVCESYYSNSGNGSNSYGFNSSGQNDPVIRACEFGKDSYKKEAYFQNYHQPSGNELPRSPCKNILPSLPRIAVSYGEDQAGANRAFGDRYQDLIHNDPNPISVAVLKEADHPPGLSPMNSSQAFAEYSTLIRSEIANDTSHIDLANIQMTSEKAFKNMVRVFTEEQETLGDERIVELLGEYV